MCFSYHVYYSLLVLCFYRGISSTPELLESVLRPRTALYCGDELMREQQQQTTTMMVRFDKLFGKIRYVVWYVGGIVYGKNAVCVMVCLWYGMRVRCRGCTL